MQIFLYYAGMRSISLLVDLTNYLMLELGQPMHAFDARVVKKIEVGLAKEGDTFTTLDNVKRTLSKDTLMIKNGNEYFGIAGVMGGLDSEILPDTTSLFLESATFNAGSIRRTAVKLGLRTEASARYEKSLDPNMASTAIERLVYLLRKENPDLVVASRLTDVYPNVLNSIKIDLKKDLITTYMGEELSDDTIVSILESLEFKVEVKKDSYEVTIPTFRHSKDINIAEDLIEEIARIYGLENIKSEPLKLSLNSKELETVFNEEYDVKYMLATKYNMHEVNSYIWYDSNMLKELGIEKDGVRILGKSENNILRDDLSFSLLNIVNENFKNNNEFSIFEIGTIIKNGLNKRILSIILAGSEKDIESMYNKAKGIVSYIYKALKNTSITLDHNNDVKTYYDSNLSKQITINDTKHGEINVLQKSLVSKLSKKKSVVCIDIDFDKYIELNTNTILEKKISKYPTVSLDYTVILPNGTKYEVLQNVINEFKSNLIQSWELVGIYENKYTIRYILGSDNKTLEQKDIQSFKERFIKHLNDNNLQIVE